MPLTRAFREVVVERVQRDPEYRDALLAEAIRNFFNGELNVSKSQLRNLVNATVGFQGLADATGMNNKSLMRMLSKSGNPTLQSFSAIVRALQDHFGSTVQVEVVGKKRRPKRKAKKVAAKKRVTVKG